MSEQREFIRAQLASGVDYYKGEKGDKPVKGVDYFTEEDIADIVSAIESGDIDFSNYATKEYVDTAIENADIIVTETDPTVPSWAKAESKPTYTAAEVGALPDDTVLFSGDYEDLTNKPTIPTVPTNISAFTNDSGYLTEHQSLSGYATEGYVATAISAIDMSSYATKDYVDTAVAAVDLTDYATKEYVATAVGAIDLTGYATESYVATAISAIDMSDYATKDFVATAVSAVDLTGYATEEYVTTAIGAIDFSGYATESYVNTAISAIDLSGYATQGYVTTAISAIDLTNYATQAYVTTAIAAKQDALPFNDYYSPTTGNYVMTYEETNEMIGSATSLLVWEEENPDYDPEDPDSEEWVEVTILDALGRVEGRLDGFATGDDISAAIESIDLSSYATQAYVNTAVGAIDVSNYATQAYVTTAISAIDVSNYATHAYVTTAIAAIPLDEYATIDYVDSGRMNGEFPECDVEEQGARYLQCQVTEGIDWIETGEEDENGDPVLEEVTNYNYDYYWVPENDLLYTLPAATTSTLGGVKVDGSSITINNNVISAPRSVPVYPTTAGHYMLSYSTTAGNMVWESVVIGGSY